MVFDRLWPPRRSNALVSKSQNVPVDQQVVAGDGAFCELRINSPSIVGEQVHLTADLVRPNHATAQIWFTVPKRHRWSITRRADPFLLAAFIPAATTASLLKVTGAPASASLLRNLAAFQDVWQTWRGFKTTAIEAFTAPDEIRENGPAIAAFSGGVDSSFTVYRHTSPLPNRHALKAALMVHGFDIPLTDSAGFRRAAERARRMLESVGVPLILMQTNAREFLADWEMMHGTAVAAALTFFSKAYTTGLIASTGTYSLPLIPWGSNPLTDPLLGSRRFALEHDGAHSSRLDKVRALCGWPEGLRGLRFCFQNLPAEGNCGKCLKCILTALEFRCCGVDPECFSEPVSDNRIMDALLNYRADPFGDAYFKEARDTAVARGMPDPWVPLLDRLFAT